MSDEAKLRRQQERGERAKRILEDDLVKDAFHAIESQIIESWKNSVAEEKGIRDNAYLMHRLLQNLKGQFSHALATGEAARKELLRIKDPSKLKRMLNG